MRAEQMKNHVLKSFMARLLRYTGLFLVFVAFLYAMLITSDIPVSLSAGELIVLYTFLVLSSICMIYGVSILSKPRTNTRIATILMFVLIWNLAYFLEGIGSEYFDMKYVLLISPLWLQPLVVIFVLIYGMKKIMK